MGTCTKVEQTFLPESATDEQLDECFRQIQNMCEWEDGYSGTILEATCLEIRRDLRFETVDDVFKVVHEIAYRRGPAVAVLCDEAGGFVFAGAYPC